MEQEASKNSHPISSINLSFPENRVVPPVCPVPAPSAWLWGWGGRPAFEQGHIPGGVAPPHSAPREGPPVVPPGPPQPPLKCCCYTTAMNSGMSLVIYGVTLSLRKWHCQASRAWIRLACFSIDPFSPAQNKASRPHDVLLTGRLLRAVKFKGRKYRERLRIILQSSHRHFKTHQMIWPCSLLIRSFLEISWSLLRLTFCLLSLLPWLFPSSVHFLHEINEESYRLRFQRTYDSWVMSIFFLWGSFWMALFQQKKQKVKMYGKY